jgi:GT2 family glycosyltransferase
VENQPLVSVVITNWNGHNVLPACLDALARQVYRPLEVIIVDNGSVDDSLEIAGNWQPPAGICKKSVPIDRNLGFAGGTNRGIEQASGEFVALLNNDTEADPKWISELVLRLQARPEIGFCASKLLLFDERDRLDTAGHGFSRAGAGFAHLRWSQDNAEANVEQEVFGACAAASIYRKTALDKVGIFDEDFFCYYEDLDLDFRLQLAGFRCLYVPSSVVYHKVSASSGGTRSDFVVHMSSRNQEWMYVKDMPGTLFWTRLPAHLVYNIGRFVVYSIKGQPLPFLRGKWQALIGLRQALAKRKQVQATKAVADSELAARFDRSWFRRHFLDHLGRGK